MAAPAPRAVPWLSWIPLGLLVAGGIGVVLCAAGTHGSLVPLEAPGVRGWIEGPLASLGLHAGHAAFVAALVAMVVGYLGVLACGDAIAMPAVASAAAILFLAFALAPPLLSTDVMSYIDYARLLAVHHLSPYAHPPRAAPHDAVFAFVHWRGTRSAYGPLFTAATYPLGLASPGVALWVLKGACALAAASSVALVGRIAQRLGHSPARAAAAFGLNPLLLVWTIGGGHNDTLMIAGLLAGVLLVLDRRDLAGGAVLVGALAIKVTAALGLPFAALAAHRRRRFAAGVAAAGAAVAAVSYIAFPDHGVGLFSVLHNQRHLLSIESTPHEVLGLFGLHVTPLVRLALTGIFVASAAWIVLCVRRGMSWITALGWAILALVATSTWLVPWYTIWSLPLAAATRDRRLLAATLLLEAAVLSYDLTLTVLG